MMCERWCVKDGVWQSDVSKMVCDKVVCERWWVTKMVGDKVVCERWCVKDGGGKVGCKRRCVKDGV